MPSGSKIGHYFLLAEYVEQVRESAALIASKLDHMRCTLRNRNDPEFEPIREHVINVIDRMHFETRLTADNIVKLGLDNLEETNALWVNMDKFNRGIEYLSQTLLQGLESTMSEQTYFHYLSTEQIDFKKTLFAIEKLIAFIFGKYHPEGFRKDSLIIPFFGNASGYQIFPLEVTKPRVAFSSVPKVDACRCRFWSWLGHEAFHSRYSSKLGEAGERMKSDIVDDVRNLAMRQFGINLRQLAALQVEEASCDTVALRLFGPAYVLALSGTYMNPHSEAGSFDVHPPMAARVNYLGALLEKKAGFRGSSDPIRMISESWERALSTSHMSYRELSFIEEYGNILQFNMNRFYKISSEYSPALDSQDFDFTRWNRLIGICKKLEEGEDLNIYDLNFPDLLNLVWIKRITLFDACNSEKEKSDYFTLCRFDEKMTSVIVKYMCNKEEDENA